MSTTSYPTGLGKLIGCYFKAAVFVGLGTGYHEQPPKS